MNSPAACYFLVLYSGRCLRSCSENDSGIVVYRGKEDKMVYKQWSRRKEHSISDPHPFESEHSEVRDAPANVALVRSTFDTFTC